MPLGYFGVPARYRRVAGSLLTVSWWWAQTQAERPSLSPNLPAPVAGQCCIHLGERLVLGGRVVTLPALIGFSTCAASWHLSNWDVPRVDFCKASCGVCSSFLVVMITGSVVFSCWKWQTGAWGTRDSDERWHQLGLLRYQPDLCLWSHSSVIHYQSFSSHVS